jgi:hypothetical protein
MNIIFDLDETLIYNGHNPKSSLDKFEIPYSPRLSDKFMLRPYTKEVLKGFSGMCNGVFLASFSTKNRIEQVLRASDIAGLFSRVFTRENLDPCYRPDNYPTTFHTEDFLLIDDKGIDDKHTQMKIKYFGGSIGADSAKILNIPPFDGMETDTVLLTVLKEITTRIQLAGQTNVRAS